jgi:uncharacterized protein (TIGR03437 family)
MHHPIIMNQAHQRSWSRTAIVVWMGFVSLSLPVLCQAQTPPTYTISTIVGQGPPITASESGDTGPAISAILNAPTSVAFDSKGNMYIADQGNNDIRWVSNGNINLLAGNGVAGYSGDGAAVTSASINYPDTVAVDSKGNLYFSDTLNGAIRMITPTGIISTFAGSQVLGIGGTGDGGPATSAELDLPAGIAFDSAGNLYIADSGNFRIRMVTASTGIITTIAGSGTQGFSNGTGAATSAHLNGTRQIAVAPNGAIYIADSHNNQIRKISNGIISLVAGSPTALSGYSGDGGLAVQALLNAPTGVAVDSAGNIYICDKDNDRIRMVTPDGIIHTIAGGGLSVLGSPSPGYSGDGGPALSAQFDEPTSIILDSSGNLYIADVGNNIIRKLVPNAAPSGPGPAPALKTAGAVISASDFGALTSVGPGSWIEVYGTNLASATREWATSDFVGNSAPSALNNTLVTIGGESAFVEYISPTQVNAQVPGTIGLGTQPVTVTTPAGTSSAFNVNINLQEPGLFAPVVFRSLIGGNLQQWVGALFTDLSTYVFPTGSFAGVNSRPAKPGDTIVIYGVGFGPVPGNPAGQIPQTANGLTLPIIPKFYFNGVQAQVTYAGLAPQTATTGYIGLYQFNVIVPAIAASNSVPVTFTVNENGTDVKGTQTLYTSVGN